MHYLKPTVKRNLSLFSVLAWQKGYEYYLKKELGWKFPIIFHFDGVRVNLYHKQADFDYFKKHITARLISDDELFHRLNSQFQTDVATLQSLIECDTLPLNKIAKLLGKVMSFYIFVVSDAFVTARPEAWQSRQLSETIAYDVDKRVEAELAKQIPPRYDPRLARFIGKEGIDLALLKTRQKGYIVFGNQIITGLTFDQFCSDHTLQLPDIERKSEIKGMVACEGYARGTVAIIQAYHDLQKVTKDSILVAPMTNVKHIAGIKLAKGLVTDEGGITCHAAIIARELQKPCITGTQIGTSALKDGDIIELDTTTGVVKIL